MYGRLIKAAMCLSLVCGYCVCALGAIPEQDREHKARKHSLSVEWGVAVPVAPNFIDKASAANVTVGWSYRIVPVLSLGLSGGYVGLSDRGVATEYFDSALVSGYREKTLRTYSVMAQFDVFPLGRKETVLRPYFGVGVGAGYARFHITGETIVTSAKSDWADKYSARIGTRIFPRKTGRLFIDARFAWEYGRNSWATANVRSVQNLGVMIGIGGTF